MAKVHSKKGAQVPKGLRIDRPGSREEARRKPLTGAALTQALLKRTGKLKPPPPPSPKKRKG